MVAVIETLVFAGAFVAAMWVFAFTLVPALPLIASLLLGEQESAPALQPARILNDPRPRERTRPTAAMAPRRPAFRAAA